MRRDLLTLGVCVLSALLVLTAFCAALRVPATLGPVLLVLGLSCVIGASTALLLLAVNHCNQGD